MTRAALQSWTVKLVAGIVFLNGLLAIMIPLAHRMPERIETIITPVGFEDFARSLDLFLGFVLMYVSIQLWQRKLVAWWIATVIAWLLVAVSLLRPTTDITAIGPLLAGIVLLLCRPYFNARSESRSIKQGLLVLGLSVLLTLGYGVAGFYFMGERNFGVSLSLGEAFQRTINAYLLIGNPDLLPYTHQARWFLDSLFFLGAASLGYGLYSLFRPLDYRYRTLPHDRQLAQDLIADYSRTSEDFFKLWPRDKSYYFDTSYQAVIAYAVESGIALCLGDPVGRDAVIPDLLREFKQFCQTHGWTTNFIYTTDNYLPAYESIGLSVIKIGEDAVIDVPNFAGKTSNDKHFRNINNRFTKAGYNTDWYAPPHSATLLREITEISRAWRRDAGRREWGFLAGSFNTAYMQQCRLFVLRDEAGRARAFTNEIPASASGETSIDLMRYVPDSPSNLMDFLFLKLLIDLNDRGVATFNLGLAPLSGLGEGETRFEEKLLHLIYRINQPFLSFRGLRQFKTKFEPQWQPRYVVYEGVPTRLARIALALARVSRVK